ncbi:MAG: hypothetical protein JNG83_11125 [Opitutaceae bacterium]|nr:hypothetical protein [Opitutaceae bacterium]
MTRPILRLRAIAAVVLAPLGFGAAAPGPLEFPQPARVITLRSLPLLLVDDSVLVSRRDLVRRQHAATSLPAPVVVADRPWEGQRVYVFGTAQFDPEQKRFQLWYVGVPDAGEVLAETGRVFVPGFRQGGATLVLYATSADGRQWDKPVLGLHAFAGSTANNIVFDLDSPSVIRDEHDPDPGRRYKMVGYSSGSYWSAVSPDGVRWRGEPEGPILEHGTTVSLTQNPETGEFLVFHKRPQQVRGFDRRVVWLSRSPDFRRWSPPELVLAPDEADDLWVRRPQERTEIHSMPVFPHAGGYLGLPTVMRVEYELPPGTAGRGQSPTAGSVHVELASSPDGRRWERAWPRLHLVPPGEPGTFNGGAVIGLASAPVNVGTETWIYYTVLTTHFGSPMPPKRISVARASWRRDGYVSLEAGPEGGRLETVPLRFAQARLLVNADARRGWLRAAILESDGRPIDGLGLAECLPFRDDTVGAPLGWTGGRQPPTDRPVRVLIEMAGARLFSLASSFTSTHAPGAR